MTLHAISATDRSESQTPDPAGAEDTAKRGRMGTIPGIQILGTGSFVPDRVVTNEDLAALGCDSEWIIRRTGIRERRHADPSQATSDLCYEAAIRCLQDAGVGVEEVDLILVATITPDHPTPATACHLQRRLGALAPAMDLGAACAGFMYALITAGQFVAAGNAKNVLVVGADLMSRTIDPDDKKTYPLFGDAAGAALVGASDDGAPDGESAESGSTLAGETPPADISGVPQTGAQDSQATGVLSYQLGSEGCGGEMLCIHGGGTRQALTKEAIDSGAQYLRMDGRNVFKWAVRVFDESSTDVLEAAGVAAEDLRLVILHQANQRIIDAAVSGLCLPPDRVFVNLDRYGNTSGASIPLALDEAVRQGHLRRGDLLLLCGFGAGLAWGTALLRY